MQIFADDQGTFCLFFACYFTSCAKNRMHYHSLEYRNTALCLFNRDQNSKVAIAPGETIGFYTLR